jgi:hypothetical protein
LDTLGEIATILSANEPNIDTLLTQIGTKQATITSSNRLDASLIGTGNVNNTALGYVSNVSSDLQTQLNAKQATISTGNRVDASLVGTGAVSNTRFNYLSNTSSDIQTQLNAKAGVSSLNAFTKTNTFQSVTEVVQPLTVASNILTFDASIPQHRSDGELSTAPDKCFCGHKQIDHV